MRNNLEIKVFPGPDPDARLTQSEERTWLVDQAVLVGIWIGCPPDRARILVSRVSTRALRLLVGEGIG